MIEPWEIDDLIEITLDGWMNDMDEDGILKVDGEINVEEFARLLNEKIAARIKAG